MKQSEGGSHMPPPKIVNGSLSYNVTYRNSEHVSVDVQGINVPGLFKVEKREIN